MESLAAYPGARVVEVRLRVGALSAVIEDSFAVLLWIAAEGTPLEMARLVVTIVPVVMHCVGCDADVELESVQSFRCPRCGAPCFDLRQGRELKLSRLRLRMAWKRPVTKRLG